MNFKQNQTASNKKQQVLHSEKTNILYLLELVVQPLIYGKNKDDSH